MTEASSSTLLYCNFCRKTQHDVRLLIAGPTSFICNECVILCLEILVEDIPDLELTQEVVKILDRNMERRRLPMGDIATVEQRIGILAQLKHLQVRLDATPNTNEKQIS